MFFEQNVEKIDSRTNKVEELYNMRNEFGNFVVKEEMNKVFTQINDLKTYMNDVTFNNNSRINKSNKSLTE